MLEKMLLPNNYSNTKLNKYCDVDDTNLSELADLLQDFLSVNIFQIGHDRNIKNVILKQIENKGSTIVIKNGYFQNNEKILFLIQHLSEEELEITLRLAIEKSFNCNLSHRKIIFLQEYPISAIHME